jgi:hypothetical protein
MTHKNASFPTVTHAAAIPNLDGCIVRARVKNVWRRLVSKTNSIDIVIVSGNFENRLTSLEIVDVYGMIRRASNDLSTVTGKAY